MRYMKAKLKRSICNGQVFLAMLLCLGIYAFGEGYQGWVNIVLYPGTTWIHNHNGFMMEFNPFRSLLPLPAVFAAGNLLIEDWEHRGFCVQTTRTLSDGRSCAGFGSCLLFGIHGVFCARL